jgi:hypothetical protein
VCLPLVRPSIPSTVIRYRLEAGNINLHPQTNGINIKRNLSLLITSFTGRCPHRPTRFHQNYISTSATFSLGVEKINPADDAKALLAQPNAAHCCTCKVVAALVLAGATEQLVKE